MSITINFFNYIHHKDNEFSNINLIFLKFIICYFFSIFQRFHFESSIKIMHFFLLFLLYIITIFAKNAQNFSIFL